MYVTVLNPPDKRHQILQPFEPHHVMTDLEHPHKVGVVMGWGEVVGQIVIRVKRIGMRGPESTAFGSGGHLEQTGVIFTWLIS